MTFFLTVASKAGKLLAPYLKSVVPHWWMAQFDPHPPASSAAAASFEDMFPAAVGESSATKKAGNSKRENALNFCKAEILTLVEDSLLNQTAETMSDPK